MNRTLDRFRWAVILLVGTLFAVTVATAQGPERPVEAADAGEDQGPSSIEDVVVQLERGQDRDIAAYYIFDKLDVDDDERCEGRSPCRQVYEYEWAINGLWLRLTPQERRLAEDLIGEFGIVAVAESTKMALPVEPVDLADMTGRGYDYSPQVTTPGCLRVGCVPGDYSNVTIGIIDTGTDMLHDDLNVVGGFDCTLNDPGQHGEDGWGIDSHGHSTHVGEIAAGEDNDRFTFGPAAGAQIRSYKVFGQAGSASTAQVLCGVDRAAKDALAERVDVVNMSLGGGHDPSVCGGSDPYHNGTCFLANLVPVVVAAGNDAIDAVFKAPASYPEVVTVSALTDVDGIPGRLAFPSAGCGFAGEDDALAPFSNYGSAVDFIAPGVCVLSALPQNQAGYMSGTSMASPMVAGVIAAYISECGEDGPNEGTTAVALNGSGFESVRAVLAWSSVPRWTEGEGSWTGDVGPDLEPLIRAGAPCGYVAATE